jgi:hypothetical protein
MIDMIIGAKVSDDIVNNMIMSSSILVCSNCIYMRGEYFFIGCTI